MTNLNLLVSVEYILFGIYLLLNLFSVENGRDFVVGSDFGCDSAASFRHTNRRIISG